MLEILSVIFFWGSFIGLGIIGYKKIPILNELPKEKINLDIKNNLLNLKKEAIEKNPFKGFSFEIFLQKILSKIRILNLKIENKTANWLQKLREKSCKKKENEKDDYWKKIKKSK